MWVSDMSNDNKISFNINYNNIIAAILYVINKMNGKVNKYNLMKIIFAADKYHLNKYGRPVTGDYYISMEYGTVPSNIKNMIDGNNRDYYLNILQIDDYPFKVSNEKRNYFIESNIKPNMDYLSQSDTEALDNGISEYAYLSFEEVMEKNHNEKCWQETELNTRIPFEKIIDDKEIVEYLRTYSKSIVL